VKVIGLDLSIAGTGICIPDERKIFRAWTVQLDPYIGDFRLGIIRRSVRAHLPGIDFAVLEDLPHNAMAAGISGMVHGVVRDELNDHGVPYVLIVPATLKCFATGGGKADKKAMVAGMKETMSRQPDTHNAADAFWLWAAGMDYVGQPVCPRPAAWRRRLHVADWTPVQGVIDAAIMAQESAQSF
jgi:hypothetical protein